MDSQASEANGAKSQRQILDDILLKLRSGDEALCLAAIAELGTIKFTSEAVVLQLEKLVLQEHPKIREAALQALDLRTSQFVSAKLSTLSKSERQVVLGEIAIWQDDGLIEPHRAEMLRRHYDFDMRTEKSTQEKASEIAAPAPQIKVETATPKPEPIPAAPKQSLMEVLLSESAIKIYLYLGAFFVIAAAAILAALVEAARLPVLLIATALFAGGAIGLKKRLPQPSFALAIVFSFLLPIDANVLADSLNLSMRGYDVYWTIVFFLMTVIWALGTWFYASRLFSVAAFISLSLTALRFSEIFDASTDWKIFVVAIANLIALVGVSFLKRWKEQKFALPVFLIAHVLQITLLAISFGSAMVNQFDSGATAGSWIASALTWILAASFYVASDLIIPFLFFPWMAVASLFLVPWLFLSTFDASNPVQIVGFAVWGIVHAVTSELVQRTKRPEMGKYHYPLLTWSLPLFIVAITWGLIEDTWYGFATLLCAGISYTLVNIARPRWYVWTTALLAGLCAYFTFFALPFMENVEISGGYQMLGASLLLLVPELLFKSNLTLARAWRWPPVMWGVLVAAFSIMSSLAAGVSDLGIASIILGVNALLFAAYAIHLKRPVIGYFATACAALAAIYALRHFDSDWWLPTLTALSAIYYVSSYLPRGEGNKPWSAMLANSGLVLGGIISVAAMIASEAFGGWYALGIAALFIIEMFVRKNSWLEFFALALLSISLIQILDQFNVYEEAYQLFGLGLLWLVSDMVFKFTFAGRKLESITRIVAGMLTLASTVLLATDLAPGNAAIYFAVYTLVAMAYVWVYNNPLLGYAPASLFALTVYFTAKTLGVGAWIFPQIAVAMLYYAAGYFLRRAGPTKGWDAMLIFSGLGLGTLVALASPYQSGGLEKAIPIAIAATLYAAEAFARKNVWLGFPANILYLISYFVILNELNVDEPQFFTVGAAALGLLQHYLLRRAGNKQAAFITGLVSQLVLLGASYIQMVDNSDLKYFFLLFFQALVVLIYGIVVRSRSLVIAPIGFVVLAILTILFNEVRDLAPVLVIGIAGLILITLGILAVVMRERITNLAERFSDWEA